VKPEVDALGRPFVLCGVMRRIAVASIAGIILLGCAGGGGTTENDASNATGGTGASNGGGSGGTPEVTGGTSSDGGSTSAVRCGDYSCAVEQGEDCETCSTDCGECPTCGAAPTCSGAMAVPTSTTHVDDCDNSDRVSYACGIDTPEHPDADVCIAPELRIRIRNMHIERDGGIFVEDKGLYCIITGEDGSHSELLLTPRAEVGKDGSDVVGSLSDSIFWGQSDLFLSVSNLTITYKCYLGTNAATYEQILGDVSDAAADNADAAGEYGWVFGAASLASQIIGSALGAGTDDEILSVQQTIDKSALLDFTNGRSWTIRQDKGEELRLDVESWGCAEARKVAP
jgi:hypothetical protein